MVLHYLVWQGTCFFIWLSYSEGNGHWKKDNDWTHAPLIKDPSVYDDTLTLDVSLILLTLLDAPLASIVAVLMSISLAIASALTKVLVGEEGWSIESRPMTNATGKVADSTHHVTQAYSNKKQ